MHIQARRHGVQLSTVDVLFDLADVRPQDGIVIVSDTKSDERVARTIFEAALDRGDRCDLVSRQGSEQKW